MMYLKIFEFWVVFEFRTFYGSAGKWGGENHSVELIEYSETLPREEHKNTNPEHEVISELLLDLDSQYLVQKRGMLNGG